MSLRLSQDRPLRNPPTLHHRRKDSHLVEFTRISPEFRSFTQKSEVRLVQLSILSYTAAPRDPPSVPSVLFAPCLPE